MTPGLSLEGTTITLFGNREEIDFALAEELERRGWSTHTVTSLTGWLPSSTHAVLRADTEAGRIALQQLSDGDQPPAHVVAVCERGEDDVATRLVHDLCETCGDEHDMSLIWHAPLGQDDVVALGASIVDEVVAHRSARSPAFVSRTFAPDHS